MLEPETPFPENIQPENENNIQLKAENIINFISNKNNTFEIKFNKFSNYIIINACLKNNELFKTEYEKKYNLNELKKINFYVYVIQ